MNAPAAGRGWTRRRAAAAALLPVLLPLAGAADAGVPAAYAPVVVEPRPDDAGRLEFDLRPAQQRARQLGRALYVYLGADDCPYCRRYEDFLAENAGALARRFAAGYVVADLRGRLSLAAERLMLRTEALRLPYADFQRAIGDARARLLVYPCIWLLDAGSGRPLMQMPAGAGTFLTVDEQIEILDRIE
ncbi:thioredoxin family protein [Sphaerotilus uruguayifluvii]|uniref:Thiol-disulfide isomerase/thioredoxin n=1 Tax=Sphaerotilus uruguayifluvii TaxID=2735897 RepID=A0ABX2FZA9_9BURK|nr:thioredoxin family protein [Leptothrix sp. C29]NRT55139.1 thiol-disulfide isomerase/thioredoxin [Leptothrix sp. C29]